MVNSRPTFSISDQLSDRERANLAELADYSSVQSLPEIWPLARSRFGQTVALSDPHAKPPVSITYSQLAEQIQQFAGGLQALGIGGMGDSDLPPRVALFADNSPRWLIADQGIMTAGAANVVRGATADRDELLYILKDSGSIGLVVEDLGLFNKLRPHLDELPVQLVILLSNETVPSDEKLRLVNFPEIMEAGENQTLLTFTENQGTLATLLYTSGTTGKPKGVMLTHGNLLHQIRTFGTILAPRAGDRILNILPTWHAYERTCEYFLLSQGCTLSYTNLRFVKRDLKEIKPHLMVGVPRLWESIYEGVQKQLREQPAKQQKLANFFLNASRRYIEARRILQGLTLSLTAPTFSERLLASLQLAVFWPIHTLGERLVYQKIRLATGGEIKQVISGGGSLAMHLDTFYEIIGVEILVGYGLTETSPVLTVRRPWHNLRGSAGQPIAGTEIRIVDPESRQPLPIGDRGLVLARGPQIMQGYYQHPEATSKAIDPEGWFDTGDLGWLTPEGDLVLTGRAKDTIVLSNGENIEPQPIEDACLRSAYIDQIMLVGQDQKYLGALIVPNLEALQLWANQQNLQLSLPDQASSSSNQFINLDSKIVQDLFRQELNREVQNRPGYRADDRIGPFKLIPEPFSTDNGMLTQTLKIKRPVVMERYGDTINGMFA